MLRSTAGFALIFGAPLHVLSRIVVCCHAARARPLVHVVPQTSDIVVSMKEVNSRQHADPRRVSDFFATIGRLHKETGEHSNITSIIAQRTNKLMAVMP